MKAQLVYLDDTAALEQIKDTLKMHSPFMENPSFDNNFDRIMALKNTKQPLFAIGISPNQPKHIKLLYSVHSQYKLTRQLCKCVHIEQITASSTVSKGQIQEFHKDLITQLDCYKVIALNVEENSVLKPNQKFMSIQKKANL